MGGISSTKLMSDFCPLFGEDSLGQPACYLAGTYRRVVAKTADYTCLQSDTGTFFTTVGATGDVEFTLPAVSGLSGWHAWFMRAGSNHEILVTAPDETLIAFNDATADAIAFTTTAEQIGCGFYIVCDGTYYIACPILGSETATPTITSG